MRPQRSITKQRNRKRQDLRRDLVHAAGDTYTNCGLTLAMTSEFYEIEPDSGGDMRDDYLDAHSRPVSVPRSLRHIHGRFISPPPPASSPVESVPVADSAILVTAVTMS